MFIVTEQHLFVNYFQMYAERPPGLGTVLSSRDSEMNDFCTSTEEP